MALTIPTRTDVVHYEIEVDLDERTYLLEFRWNDRAQAWFMAISDVNGTLLLAGRRVDLDVPLLARYRDPRLPAGELTAVDTTGADKEPGVADLGARVKLIYFPFAEIPADFRG